MCTLRDTSRLSAVSRRRQLEGGMCACGVLTSELERASRPSNSESASPRSARSTGAVRCARCGILTGCRAAHRWRGHVRTGSRRRRRPGLFNPTGRGWDLLAQACLVHACIDKRQCALHHHCLTTAWQRPCTDTRVSACLCL